MLSWCSRQCFGESGFWCCDILKPGSPGIPSAFAQLTRVVPFNDLQRLEEQLSKGDVAGVILEAVPGNMGCIVPEEGYFSGTHRLCTRYGAVSIVDEVMTGFRLSRGGACEYQYPTRSRLFG